jgi:hypothetical protein
METSAMPSASELLARLRDPSDQGAAARLADLVVDDVLATPVGRLVDPSLVVTALRESLRAWSASAEAATQVLQRLETARAVVASHGQPLGERVPSALREGLRSLVQLPLPARRDMVLRLLDRPGIKQVIRAQLVQTLADFGRRVASPVSDNALARGLGGLGKLAGRVARPSPLGAIASAVSGEVERQVEKRATEFADTAVAEVLAGIADQASDPTRAAQQAALRLELVDGLLALTGTDVGELAGASLPGQVSAVRNAVAVWVASSDFDRDVETPLSWVLAQEGERPLGALLEDLALRDPVRLHACLAVRAAVTRLVAGDAFVAWLEALAK